MGGVRIRFPECQFGGADFVVLEGADRPLICPHCDRPAVWWAARETRLRGMLNICGKGHRWFVARTGSTRQEAA